MFYTWLIVIIVLSLIEIITINLTTIWFVISGIVSLLLTLLTDSILIQFGVFVILGIILLITTRPLIKKLNVKANNDINLERITNRIGLVTKEILVNSTGEVKIDGKYWTAYADRPLKIGTSVKVIKIDGSKLKVEKGK